METKTIKYRKGGKWGNGKESTITLSYALIGTWLVAKGLENEKPETNLAALREAIEETPEPKYGDTFQDMVEYLLLWDIRNCIQAMQK